MITERRIVEQKAEAQNGLRGGGGSALSATTTACVHVHGLDLIKVAHEFPAQKVSGVRHGDVMHIDYV